MIKNICRSKIERFLQCVDSNGIYVSDTSSNSYDHRKINFSVVQPTTPANYFHLLRRQMIREYRKPLVVFSPKIGLRSQYYISNIQDFSLENSFKPIIVNHFSEYNSSHNMLFCTGQIFMEVLKACESYSKKYNKKANLVLIRIEELAPFPENVINQALGKFKIDANTKVAWIQEESMNMGAFSYVQPQLNRIFKKYNDKITLEYIGRDAQCAAIGCSDDHKQETNQLFEALNKFIEI